MNDSRIEKLESLKTHPWLRRVFAKIGKADEQLMIEFCRANAYDTKDEFEARVNRMFMDCPKPKRWKEILELLANANAGYIS